MQATWFSRTIPIGNNDLRTSGINLELSKFTEDQYVTSSFQVITRGDVHEIRLLLDKSKVNYYIPKSESHYKVEHAPGVVRIITRDPLAVNSNIGSPFSLDSSPIASTYVSFDTNTVLLINLTGAGVPYSTGQHNLYNNKIIRYLDGSYLEVEPWSVYLSKDIDTHTNFPNEIIRRGILKVYRKLIVNSSDSLLEANELSKSNIIASSFIPHGGNSTSGWLYILYCSNESLDINNINPQPNSIITNQDNSISITFNKPVVNSGDINQRLYISNGSSSYQTGTGFTVNNNTVVIGLPASGLSEGFHYVKFSGTNLYSKDGDYFRAYDPIFHSSYYRRSNKLNDLNNVSVENAVSGQALITDGTSWYPGTVASSGSSGGMGGIFDLGSVTDTSLCAIFDFGGLT